MSADPIAKMFIYDNCWNMHIGDQKTGFQCPFCKVRHERAFDVARIENGFLYICRRAKCGKSGFVPTGYWEEVAPDSKQTKKPRPYVKKLSNPTVEDEEFFRKTWRIQSHIVASLAMVTQDDEYAWALKDPNGYIKGWVIRQPVWKNVESPRKGVEGKPRALTYKNRPEYSPLGWGEKAYPEPRVVLVEDMVSVMKILGVTSAALPIALNGTNLPWEGVKEIAEVNPLEVVIWLDPDATKQAYAIQNKWGLSFNYCRVVSTDNDPKDETDHVIREVLDA